MKIDQMIKFQPINEKLTQVTLSHEFSGTIVELGAQVGAELADFPLALSWNTQNENPSKDNLAAEAVLQNLTRLNFPNH